MADHEPGHLDISQAAFARLTGITPRQVNNWCRGRAAVPAWAALVAVLLEDHSPEALTIMLEEVLQTLSAAGPAPPAVDAKSALPAR